VGVVL